MSMTFLAAGNVVSVVDSARDTSRGALSARQYTPDSVRLLAVISAL